MKLTHASTFSGIGGPEVAAAMLGWDNLFHCEINNFGRSVLEYWFPNSKSYDDITKTDFSQWRGKVDVLTGGFPCQPFSYAGKRRGSEDDRYLWPFMLRCIEEVRPTWFVGENVAGITTMVFPGEDVKVGEQTDLFGEGDEVYEKRERYVLDEIIQNLERAGYSVQPFVIPACAVGAPHRRDRVFIVARRVAESLADTNGCDNGTRRPEEPTGTIRCEGIQERNYVQLTEQSAEVRPGLGGPTPDPSCGGSGAQAESDRLIGEWRERLSLASQRGGSPQRTDGLSALQGNASDTEGKQGDGFGIEQRDICQSKQIQFGRGGCKDGSVWRISADTDLQRYEKSNTATEPSRSERFDSKADFDWRDTIGLLPENRWRTFPTVSPVYRGNDGFPFSVDHLTIPFSEWKRESLKAYGNAIVPQVMYEIFRCIDEIERGGW